MVYIGISYSIDFIWDFPIVIGKPIHFGDSWLDPPVLLPSPYHNPLLDLFQIFYTLLTSLNVRISRDLEEFHSLNLAKIALVTRIRKDDWSRAANAVLLQKNHCSYAQKQPKTLEGTLEKRSRNARETLLVSASAPSRCTQPTMMVVWPTRYGLGRGVSPSLGFAFWHCQACQKAKGNSWV
jgi:hypothetical protein